MGTEYSRINWPELRDFKKMYKKDKYEFEHFVSENFNYANKIKNENKDLENLLRQKTFFMIAMVDNFVRSVNENIFIKHKDLFTFLESTSVKTDEKFLKEFIVSKGNFKKTLSDNKKGFAFLGTIFSKNVLRCLFFSLNYVPDAFINTDNKEKEDGLFLTFTNGLPDCFQSVRITDKLLLSIENKKNISLHGDQIKKENKDYNDKIIEYSANSIRLILNLLFYMSAYPENVLDNPPDERIEDKVDAKQSKTITVSKEISDYLKDTELTPHLRRGHFRLLSSERFVNKKGQVVFVKSSFVKGHAKTVIGEEND